MPNRSILRVELTIRADFAWNERIHGSVRPGVATPLLPRTRYPAERARRHWVGNISFIVSQVESWWIWTEDSNNEHFYHTEYFSIQRKQHGEAHKLVYTIPIFEPLPPQYFVRYGALPSDQGRPAGQRVTRLGRSYGSCEGCWQRRVGPVAWLGNRAAAVVSAPAAARAAAAGTGPRARACCLHWAPSVL